jgi:hypothetical protein
MRRVWMTVLAVLGLSLPASAIAQTLPGWYVGPEAYGYSYRETPSFVDQWGPFAGLDAGYTFKFNRYFVAIQGDANVGYLDYKSSGSGRLNGIWNYKGELRALLGGDIVAVPSSFYISPFAGIGYRILFENQSGRTSTTGAVAYDRLSQYVYIPIGIATSISAGSWTLRPTLEYDFFVGGYQVSYLSQVGFNNDLTNRQTVGYGARASFFADTPTSWGRIGFGPFFRYWNIGQSRTTPIIVGNTFGVAFEPPNQTIEAGLALHFLF